MKCGTFINAVEATHLRYQDGAEMKILEFKELIDAVAEDYGNIDVCMDIRDNECVFAITQVLVETHQDGQKKRALLCNGNYIFDKPHLTVVK